MSSLGLPSVTRPRLFLLRAPLTMSIIERERETLPYQQSKRCRKNWDKDRGFTHERSTMDGWTLLPIIVRLWSWIEVGSPESRRGFILWKGQPSHDIVLPFGNPRQLDPYFRDRGWRTGSFLESKPFKHTTIPVSACDRELELTGILGGGERWLNSGAATRQDPYTNKALVCPSTRRIHETYHVYGYFESVWPCYVFRFRSVWLFHLKSWQKLTMLDWGTL